LPPLQAFTSANCWPLVGNCNAHKSQIRSIR